ncbi:hypothetical protein AMIS_78430 [Actinoplanes missouriensis 431]|uniref:Hemolysin-type calcium-binding protein n=1 Tax=Actinoplanes missouriensis (strain ATCC 14538 / DSM 43046 / CBS 188.64 / JCM 3121 / NBRC 102363 / NCIMB 12654 / NRRL B-3342 / UNCC 431) TaxID=512565 RepID=I0HJ76_ACTM4|nr:calcium-binding protein [Actinoplanes missouriensis]BAL93063.1 hypothetical protein AMIS_78430 [Actinoplanes missouriensis 431]
MSRSQWLTRIGVALFTTIAVGAVGTPAFAASTGTASVSGKSTVVFKAGSGRTNSVKITRSLRTITIDDKVAVKAGKGCKPVKGDKTKVRCTPYMTPTLVRAYLGDRNDVLVSTAGTPLKAYGGSGDDKITGSSGADRLVGDSGNDQIWGAAGNDSLDGGTGNDRVKGGTGNDKLYGSAGNDTVNGESGNDSLDGGSGNDSIAGSTGNDNELGGTGNDTFVQGGNGRADRDVIRGQAGRDTVSYATRTGTVWISTDTTKADDGEAGERDTVHPDIEVLVGGRGADFLRGGGNATAFYGGDGNDHLVASAHHSLLDGGNGRDRVFGGQGNDTLRGGNDNDELIGWSGNDLLDGGNGDDYLAGDDPDLESSSARGNDVLRGGPGSDRVDYNGNSKPVTVDLDGATGDDGQAGEHDTVGSDVERLIGSPQSDVLTGNSAANHIVGGFGDDVIRGGGGNDTLSGEDGADRVFGETGDDTLQGGNGNDVLTGDSGNDKEYGDAGDDTFRQPQASGADADTFAGGTGTDFVDYSYRTTSSVTLSLNGVKGDDGGDSEGDTLPADVEVLAGSALGGDTIRGSSGNDTLHGCGFGDKIYGEGGDDVIHGEGVCSATAERDSIEPQGSYLVGGAGDDKITGTKYSDRFFGDYDTPSDTPRPAGVDTLIGTSGSNGSDYDDDAADYRYASGPVITGNVPTGKTGERDKLSGISIVFGSEFDDVLALDADYHWVYDPTLYGLGGDDELYGGTATWLNGGDGTDLCRLSETSTGEKRNCEL